MGKWLLIVGIGLLLSAGVVSTVFLLREEKTEIKTEMISVGGTGGKVIEGENKSNNPAQLKTDSTLVFESVEIKTPKPKSNAAILNWGQRDGKGEVEVEFRTHNGKRWSDWEPANDPATERPDHKSTIHKAMILADEIHKIQYRFEIAGKNGQISPEVDISKAQIELVDSTKGPSPTKNNLLKEILQKIGLIKEVSARADGPRIYSRAEWGSPEPHSSDRWNPEYRAINRIVVHHTATTMTSDPAAMIRAIWHFHANSNGWGDIGYNYLVDGYGNIYQGRYYDPAYAEVNRKDVVAGHAYGWNYGTTGIAALGDFAGSNEAPEAMLRAIGDIAAFKIHRYGVDPAGYFGEWPALVGHRDVISTACPINIHKHLPSLRIFASTAYGPYYRIDHQDHWYMSQGKNNQPQAEITMKAGEMANLYFDIRNAGVDTWRRDGLFPTRLGTNNPRDRASPFAAAGWLDASRPGSFSHWVTGYNSDGLAHLQPVDEIEPGQVARFTFPVKAPEAGGTYYEFFHLVSEYYDWFVRDFNMHFKINVEPRNFAWHGVSQTVYTDASKNTVVTSGTTMNNLRAGQRYYVEAKIQNDGNQVWSNVDAHPIRLATFNPADRPSAVCESATWVSGCHRAATLQETTVNPGQVGTFGFWVEMPYHTENREFREYFNLVAEGLRWAPDQGMYWHFSVAAEDLHGEVMAVHTYTDDSMSQPQSLHQITANQRFYAMVLFKNTGNVVWKQSGPRAVHLGTQNPPDRASPFCDSTWLNATACHRVAAAQETAVHPDQTATFKFWVRAPATPGTYQETTNLTSEGFSWFKNYPITLTIVVN